MPRRLGLGEGLAWRVLLIGGALLLAAWLLVLPLLVLFAGAFSGGMEAFTTAVTDPDAAAAIRLTLTVAAIVVPANTLFGVAAAWCITRFRFRGRRLLQVLVGLPFSVSPVISGLVWVLMFGAQGWFGPLLSDTGLRIVFALPGIVLATLFVTLPFVAGQLIPLMGAQGIAGEEAALNPADPVAQARLAELRDKLRLLESRALALEGTYTRLPADQMVIQQIEQAGIATLQETATTVASRFASIKMTLLSIQGAFAVRSVQQLAGRQAKLDQQLTDANAALDEAQAAFDDTTAGTPERRRAQADLQSAQQTVNQLNTQRTSWANLDTENAARNIDHGWATPIAQHFIEAVAAAYPDRKLSIIGHSLGVTVTRDALRRLHVAEAGLWPRLADVVLLAGKGHETYQIRGTVSYPFDEREIVAELLDVRTAAARAAS